MAGDDFRIDPKTGLGPDEAPTPMWLPLLGAGLLLVGLTYVAIKASAAGDGDGPAEATTVEGSGGPEDTEPGDGDDGTEE